MGRRKEDFMRRLSLRRAVFVAAGLAVLAIPWASAGPGAASTNVKVSGLSPFAACTADDVAGQSCQQHPA